MRTPLASRFVACMLREHDAVASDEWEYPIDCAGSHDKSPDEANRLTKKGARA
jgi:hypothetical protein